MNFTSVCTFWELAGLEYQKLISRKIWETEIFWNFHTLEEEPCESDVTWGLFLNENEVNFTYTYDYVYPRSNCEVIVTSEPHKGQRSQRHCTTNVNMWPYFEMHWVITGSIHTSFYAQPQIFYPFYTVYQWYFSFFKFKNIT